MENILYISQFTNRSGKLRTSWVDTGHLRVPKFIEKKSKTFGFKVKKSMIL